MGIDLTSFEPALKIHYTDQNVENMVYKDHPALALMPKYEKFGGESMKIPLIYGNPQNRSATFSTAIASTTGSKLSAFTITRAKDYSIAQIDNETLLASRGNENAFVEAAALEIDGAINSLTRSLATKLYRDGWGDIGRINATVTGTTLTLQNVNDITNFEVGFVLQFASTQSSSAFRAAGTTLTVTAVDRSAGSMTVSADLNTITSLTSGDWIFLAGDRSNSASPSRLALAGFSAWNPSSAPSATSFFGVDRTVDVTRLGGQRLSANGAPIEEALIEGAAQVAREGGKTSHFLMNYGAYSDLQNALGSKVQYVDLKVNAQVGFRGIEVNGPRGPIVCVPDQDCPSGIVRGLQLDTWRLNSLGKMVRTFDTDGQDMLRQASSDGVEVRICSYAQLSCNAPGFNILITL